MIKLIFWDVDKKKSFLNIIIDVGCFDGCFENVTLYLLMIQIVTIFKIIIHIIYDD